MKQISALALAVALIPMSALAQDEDGTSLMEEGAKLFFRGLLNEMEPALRELEEETGIIPDLVEVVAETDGYIPYELPHELIPKLWKGKYRGQEQKWFLLRFAGTDDQVKIDTDDPEFSAWRWMPPAELPDAIVSFKRDVYVAVLDAFADHL